MFKYKEDRTKEIHGGKQWMYRFDNGYGASVVRHDFSYGNEKGLFELAVIKFYGEGDDDWRLNYDTPVTDDVLGRLDVDEVNEILEKIMNLEEE